MMIYMAKPKVSHYDFVYLISFILLLIADQFGTCDGVVQLLGGKKLIIGVPKKPGFTQFVDVQVNPIDKKQLVKVTGYSIEVFNATISHLQNIGFNVSVEFRAFVNDNGDSAGTYDTLLGNIPAQFDAVVGDVTIVANRSKYVDLTLPYAESGVKMLVKVRQDQNMNMWSFVRPFSWDLWLSTIMFSIFIGCTLRFMERNAHKNAGLENPPRGKNIISHVVSSLWLPLAQAVIPERESLVKNCSRFVLVLWLILACILMQSYSASLSSILTVDKLQPDFIGLDDIKSDPQINVGYQRDSFVRDLLVDRLNIDESRLKSFRTIQEYKDALDKGSSNGGVDAIFDEAPYIKVFLKERGPSYSMFGLGYRTGGFGFAFPKNSNITSYFSRAILNVTESDGMLQIERKYFGSNDEDELIEEQSQASSYDTSILTTYNFGGLFIVIGGLTVLALLVSESALWKKPMMLAKTFSKTLVIRYSEKASQLGKRVSTLSTRNVDSMKDKTSNQQQTIEVQVVEDDVH